MPSDIALPGSITVPAEVITEWRKEATEKNLSGLTHTEFIVAKAGAYCADLELAACDDYLHEVHDFEKKTLLKKRRPEEPASLVKKRAAELINRMKAEPSSWDVQDLAVLEEVLALIPDTIDG